MTDGVSLVVRAWLDEGCNPAYHRAMKRKLGREWPSLYSAVETLVREQMVKDCPCLECAIGAISEAGIEPGWVNVKRISAVTTVTEFQGSRLTR